MWEGGGGWIAPSSVCLHSEGERDMVIWASGQLTASILDTFQRRVRSRAFLKVLVRATMTMDERTAWGTERIINKNG